MKYLLIIICLFITACGGSSKSEPVDQVVIKTEPLKPVTSMWYGDSRCSVNPYLENKQCVPGMAMSRMKPLDFGYDRIIIHLAVNSMTWLDVHVWAYHLDDLIKDGSDKVWCVLPSWFNPTVSVQTISDYRDAMLAICINTVDPQIPPFGSDGIHYTDYNYQQVADIYADIMHESPEASTLHHKSTL